MKAIAIVPGTAGGRIVEQGEPMVSAPDDVKVRVLSVGVCGTDREEARGGRAFAPDGHKELVVGHEMLGQVADIGSAVAHVKPGDLVVFTVRRECGRCEPCGQGRPDMCRTGEYRERGIWRLDGYQAEYVVDRQRYAVGVPADAAAVGVLIEPLSIVEKAIEMATYVQKARVPDAGPEWLTNCRCLVAGLGPIGLLGAMVLRLRGAKVHGLDIVDTTSVRARWLTALGGEYIDGRDVPPKEIRDAVGPFQLVVEASGSPTLAFELVSTLEPDGIIVLTGVPDEKAPVEVPGSVLVRQMVLENLVILGSVNASRQHFLAAVEDLASAQRRWGGHIAALITRRYPVRDYRAALGERSVNEIKTVIEWHTGSS